MQSNSTIFYLLFKESIQLFYLYPYWTSVQEKVKNNEDVNIEEGKKPEVEENITYIISSIEKLLKEKTMCLMNQMVFIVSFILFIINKNVNYDEQQ